VFSPRTTFLIKPQENQTFRISYNRAYRSPSVINNHLNLIIGQPVSLAALGGPALYLLPVNITGNTDLKEQSLDAFELGYSALIKRAVLSAAYYRNWVKNEILFTEDVTGRYTAASPPANWPLNPAVIAALAAAGRPLPGRFTYLNFGESTQQGLELGINSPLNRYADVFVNYSWQAEPDPKDFDLSELNIPAAHRFNAGVSVSYDRFLGNFSVSYTDKAYWQDVLGAEYAGTTDPYTIVNAGIGAKWKGDRYTTSLKVINLGNQSIQQHAFGDITRRQIVAELRVNMAKTVK